MKRHAVHLSEDLDTANIVGSRRGSSVIIEVQSGLMFIDGYKFQISDNGVWLVDSVPSKYLKIV
jgi:putative RNA 2'-phosphotransferase